jgi:hypothetical protein
MFSSQWLGAQETPRFEVFGGYALTRFDDTSGDSRGHSLLNGWDSEFTFNATPNVGFTADVGGYYGTPSTPSFCEACLFLLPGKAIPTKMHTFLVGPQISGRKGSFRPFVHALFGAAHLSQNISALGIVPGTPPIDASSGLTVAVGGGLDTLVTERIAWRVFGDFLGSDLGEHTHKNLRIATGLVFRFGAH